MKIHKIIDLRGVCCPINFVKTKLALEDLENSEVLEVLLDQGEPIINVPKSIKDEGHKILSISQQGDFFSLIVEKVGY